MVPISYYRHHFWISKMKESQLNKIWITSDTHFFHVNILKYNRPQFKDVDEMNEFIIKQWNECIGPEDIVYHLGDFAFGSDLEKIHNLILRLNGEKRLILGNHDTWPKINLYTKMFSRIMAVEHFKEEGIILSHFPIHESQLNYGIKGNIHGHLHSQVLTDKRYKNVCWDIENKMYHLPDLLKAFKK